ncbi:hypothetical protein [Sphingobium sp. AP50]|uniref:hypothetical protein n=1 Tax=Sphingobium sp. AP50 TaxID=1884369 RepID=UPI0011603125|nr:hypothetical protein [Sphingobium sp. AP50]
MSDYVRRDANLHVSCACGHEAVLDRVKIQRWYYLHRHKDSIRLVGQKMRCTRCGGRPASIRPTAKPPTYPQWMDSEDRWKRLTRRLRN